MKVKKILSDFTEKLRENNSFLDTRENIKKLYSAISSNSYSEEDNKTPESRKEWIKRYESQISDAQNEYFSFYDSGYEGYPEDDLIPFIEFVHKKIREREKEEEIAAEKRLAKIKILEEAEDNLLLWEMDEDIREDIWFYENHIDLYSSLWFYRNSAYDILDSDHYSKEEIKLLIMEFEDKERQKFEKLRKKFSNSKSDEVKYERTRISEEVRIAVWRRDQGKCARCGSRENLEYDHIVPVSKGGSNTVRNIELLCQDCNRAKGNRIE